MARFAFPQALGNAAPTGDFAAGRFETEDHYVLGHPALFMRPSRLRCAARNTFAEQRIAAVAGANAPDVEKCAM